MTNNQHAADTAAHTVLVTGGTRGLGAEITRRLLADGLHVVANYWRNREAAEAFLNAEQTEDQRLELVRADISRAKGIETLLGALNGRRLGGFVHSAATGVHKPLAELSMREWDWTQAVNIRAFFELIIELREHFAPGASVVGLSSEGAVNAAPNYSLVGASKGALEALCRHLAYELHDAGVRVNCVSPGSVVTDAWDAFPDRAQKIARLEQRLGATGLLVPVEVANVVAFLLSEAASGINGSVLVVDKGERIFP